MTNPDPKAAPATDEEIHAFFNGNVSLCGVCLGISPSWDGHDGNPPCRQTVANRIRARIGQDRATIAAQAQEIERLRIKLGLTGGAL